VRPSIIGGSHKQPSIGWTDSLAAAGGVMIVGAAGIMYMIYQPPTESTNRNRLDLIPADFVVH